MRTRRLALAAALLAPLTVHAGAQRYEQLSASVQSLLQAAVADRPPPPLPAAAVDQPDDWVERMAPRLARHIPEAAQRRDFLVSLQYEAARAGLDPELVLGVVEVESRFHKYAVSRAGARGFMQVMPFWVRLIGDGRQNLFSLRTNLRFGCVILRHYLDQERGDMHRALARYNGSLGQDHYPDRVLGAWRAHWTLAAGSGGAATAVHGAPVAVHAAAAGTAPRPTTYLGDGR